MAIPPVGEGEPCWLGGERLRVMRGTCGVMRGTCGVDEETQWGGLAPRELAFKTARKKAQDFCPEPFKRYLA